jgi:hypothetical protein
MTLSTTASRVSYSANGATASFAFAFKIWASSNLKVYLRDTTTLTDTVQTLGVDYTIDAVTFPNAGNVVFAVAPPSGRTVVILRDLPLTQELDLVASGAFAAENVEAQLDKLAAEIQGLREMIARTPRFAVGSSLVDVQFPEPRLTAANQLVGVTAGGDGFELKSPVSLAMTTVSSFMATLLDDVDAASARTTLGISGGIDLNGLTSDSTGGAFGDYVPFVDVSDSNASNKVLVSDFVSNVVNNAADTGPAGDNGAYRVLARKVADGTLHRLKAQEIGAGKQTVWIPAAAMTARTTNGPASGLVETTTNKVMIKTLDFDASAAEYAQMTIQMPKSWNEGTLSAAFLWSHASTTTNFGVVWGVQALAMSDDDALDAAFGSSQTVSDTGGTTNDIYRSNETAAVAASGSPAENDVLVLQVYRDATSGSDTLAVDARLHGVAVFYSTNANTDN